MIKAVFAIGLLAVSMPALAQSDHYVSGYTRSNGTYVAPHEQTNPNSTRDDNYSTRGNVNPYTGQEGTKPRDEDSSGTSNSPYGSSYGRPH